MAPTFKWTCSYQGSVWYQVCDDTGQYSVELRRRADAYERKCYNGDEADWQRNIVDMIGVLRREHDSTREIPAATFHAFNAWMIDEHVRHMATLRAHPLRYGDNLSDIPPVTLARAAARYEIPGDLPKDWWRDSAQTDRVRRKSHWVITTTIAPAPEAVS